MKNWLDWLALILVIIGGLNWGLIGFFNFDLVMYLFEGMGNLSMYVYDLVGLAAVYVLIKEVFMGGK